MWLDRAADYLGRVARYAVSRNLHVRDARRLLCRRQVRHVAHSAINGEVKVVDRGRERLLLLDERCHSFGITAGNDAELYREYWGSLHRIPFPVRTQPRLLMCGLGGGTGLRVLARELQPQSITVLELDPVIVEVARQHFDIDSLANLTIRSGDAQELCEHLAAQPERFDVIVEDAMCLPTMSDLACADAQLQRLITLLAPGGALVFNGPIVSPARDLPRVEAFCARLRDLGLEVHSADAGQRWWFNRLVYARRRPARDA